MSGNRSLLVNMPSRKRHQIVEYSPLTLSSPSVPVPTGEIITHHTHFERRRRPVKSTVTVNLPDTVADSDSLTSSVDKPTSYADFIDGMEQGELEGQELEIHELAVYCDTGESTPEAVARKRRRTQGIGTLFCSAKPN